MTEQTENTSGITPGYVARTKVLGMLNLISEIKNCMSLLNNNNQETLVALIGTFNRDNDEFVMEATFSHTDSEVELDVPTDYTDTELNDAQVYASTEEVLTMIEDLFDQMVSLEVIEDEIGCNVRAELVEKIGDILDEIVASSASVRFGIDIKFHSGHVQFTFWRGISNDIDITCIDEYVLNHCFEVKPDEENDDDGFLHMPHDHEEYSRLTGE